MIWPMFNEALVKEFRGSLRGVLIEPTDTGYFDACKVYNGMIEKHPRFIAKCSDVADVIRCVNFARENKILLSVKGGGHSPAGFALCDDGLVIDLSMIRYTIVDPDAKTVVAGGGATWGDVDHATSIFGLVTPSGILSTTGVGGLTLGGGTGHLTRKLGLTVDNLLSVDMVLADGSFITANSKHNQDLFWAVRGGGGNFGVVTAFTFKLHSLAELYAGPMLYDLDDAEEVLKWYRKFIMEAAEDLTGFFMFLTVPPGPPFPEHLHLKKMCGIMWAYSGPKEKAEEAFKPVRAFKIPAFDLAGPMPYTSLQSMFDALYPLGLYHYWKSDFVRELSDEAISEHIKFGHTLPTNLSSMHLYPVNGAASRVSSSETAWNFRDANWSMVIIGVDNDPSNNEKITTWTRQYWDKLHPYSMSAAYVNFMMEEGESRVKASYGKNYTKLVMIKNKYDPENLFRVNQNIKPEREN
jgi:FAD/FMN-containing dehydrogenase